MNSLEKMQNARTRLLLKRPFFGSLALRLDLVEDNTQPTAYTDGKVIGFNSHFVDQLTKQETSFLLYHEVLHIVLKHPWRRGQRDHDLFNQAGDYVINLIVANDGLPMPDGGLFNRAYDGKSTEWVYSDLMQDQQESGGAMDAQEEKQESDSSSEGLSEYGPDDVPTLAAAAASGELGEVRDCTDADGLDQSANTDWEGAIQVALAQEKQRGTMPGKMLAAIEGRNHSTIDWKDALQNFLTDAGNDFDITWAKPSRRFIDDGLYFPSNKREGIDHLVIAVDTSGSVSDRELVQFMSETMEVVEQLDCSITLIPCDAKIGKVQQFESYDIPDDAKKFKLGGRQGTEFYPPFKWVEDNMDATPSALIYFTDGECNYPDEPEYPTFWAISNVRGFTPAPWGQSIEVKI